MTIPERRGAFFFAAVGLLIGAIGCVAVEKKWTGAATRAVAARVGSTTPAADQATEDVAHMIWMARLWSISAVFLALLGLIAWAVSVSRHERRLDSVPLVLTATFGLLCLMLV